jgi:hypothetical protein
MCKGIDMKNTLAENMLRFGVKNLNESNKDSLKALAEPNPPAGSTGRLETLNLYQDKANNTPWNTAVIVEPKTIDKIKFTSSGNAFMNIQLRNSTDVRRLAWHSKYPNELIYFPDANTSTGQQKVYNKNLLAKLQALYKKSIYNKNATYAQTNTPEPGDDQSVA